MYLEENRGNKMTKKIKAKKKTKAKKTKVSKISPKAVSKKTIKKAIKKIDKATRKYRVIYDIDTLCKYINMIQTVKRNKSITVIVKDDTIIPIVENMLRDLEVKFDGIDTERGRVYTMLYDLPEIEEDVMIQELDDEYIENGQLF